MKSEFKAGEYLFKLGEHAKQLTTPERVFIHNGVVSGDGYGVALGWSGGKLLKSSGPNNYCYGAEVRLANEEEIEEFIKSMYRQDVIYWYGS